MDPIRQLQEQKIICESRSTSQINGKAEYPWREYATRHEAITFHHDNARHHVAIPVQNYLENSGWNVLPHLPYSPDHAAFDYHLFRSMQNALSGIRFTSEQGIKNWLDSFMAAKPAQFFRDGIHEFPERWQKVIASDEKYFE